MQVDAIIETAIKSVYLTEEHPDVAAVIEEVNLQCFKASIAKPHPATVRRRVAVLPDRLKLEKRKGKKAAAEKYEPIKGHFPGADFPLAVAQIDHTPMDVIVVDEEHRQPIQLPSLTVVIDVYSRMVLGFAIYLEKPSAFTLRGHRKTGHTGSPERVFRTFGGSSRRTLKALCSERQDSSPEE